MENVHPNPDAQGKLPLEFDLEWVKNDGDMDQNLHF